MTQYEENIRATEQAALDAAESDSVMTGTSLGGYTILNIGDNVQYTLGSL